MATSRVSAYGNSKIIFGSSYFFPATEPVEPPVRTRIAECEASRTGGLALSETRIAILGGVGSGTNVAQAIADLSKAGAAISCYGYFNDLMPPGECIGVPPVIGPFEAWNDLPAEILLI